LIASGQNLKRLLQKRGWGRRPFPAQAIALLLPETQEAERLPKNRWMKNQRAGIATAFFTSWAFGAAGVEARSQLCSLLSIVLLSLVHLLITFIFVLSYVYVSFIAIFGLKERMELLRMSLLTQAHMEAFFNRLVFLL
jgi:hypothetical protein